MKAALHSKSGAFRRRAIPAVSTIAALVAACFANAQQAPAPAAKGEGTEQLDKITVTATKREESLQVVPIAVTVLSGETLELQNLNNVATITQQVPSMNFRLGASNKDTSLFIRGIGTLTTSQGAEPSVSTVVDGVVFPRAGQSTLDLVDVDRMEVLRGPQGTLFGRNASAGVVNIVTKRPSTDTERYVDFSYYQGNERRLRGGVSGELSKGLTGSVNAFVGKFDGNVKNVFLGEDVNGYDRWGVRGKLEWAARSDVTVTFIGDYAKADDTGSRGPYVRGSAAIAAAIAPITMGVENRDVSTNVKERVDDTNKGLSAQVDWRTGNHTVTSITAWRQWDNIQYQDIDGTSGAWNQIAGLSDRGQLKSKTVSEELRVASNKGKFFDYVAGFYYMKTKTDEVYRRDVVRCNGTLPNLANGLTPCAAFLNDYGEAPYGSESKNMSVFGEGVFNFTPELRAILGGRYVWDDLSYYHSRFSTQSAAIPGVSPTRAYTTGSTDETGTAGRVGGQYDFNKDVMGYVTLSRGYKGPAYNVFFNAASNRDEFPLDPEKSQGWEVGLKSTLLGNRLRVNLAYFDTKYTGYQANYPDVVAGTVVTRLINAGDVSTKGVELDFEAKVTKEFTFSGAYTQMKARVDQFKCATGATCPALDGQPLPFAPDKKGVIRGTYATPLASGYRVEVGADYTWQSETQFDLSTSPNTIQPAYGIWNAYIGLGDPRRGWRVALVGKNLSDKSYAQFLQPGANTQRSVPRDDERYYGVTARYEF
jgi:iron complex outermembrane receptor protein